jgi:ABC-type methionine transport system permease subunit
MTIVITMPGGLVEAMHTLIPLIEPIALAIAGACGAGLLVQVGLDLGFKLVHSALRPA